MDNAKIRYVTRLPTNLGSDKRWKNSKASTWSKDSHGLGTYSWIIGISKEGIVDVVNATFEEAKVVRNTIRF